MCSISLFLFFNMEYDRDVLEELLFGREKEEGISILPLHWSLEETPSRGFAVASCDTSGQVSIPLCLFLPIKEGCG